VTEWNPKVMDSTVPDEWYHSQPKVLRGLDTANYDKFGEYKLTSKDDADGGVDDEYEYLVEGVHHAEIEIHLSNLIQHETLDDITVVTDREGNIYETNSVTWNGSTWECNARRQTVPQGGLRRSERLKGQPKKNNQKPTPRPSRTPNKRPTNGQDETPMPGEDTQALITDALGENNMNAPDKDDYQPPDALTEPSSEPNNLARSADEIKKYGEWLGSEKLVTPTKRNYHKFAIFFPGTGMESIKRTFKATTQFGTRGAFPGINMKHRMVAPNPALNVPRRNEPVATDTVYSPYGVPSIDGGHLAAQFYIGRRSSF